MLVELWAAVVSTSNCNFGPGGTDGYTDEESFHMPGSQRDVVTFAAAQRKLTLGSTLAWVHRFNDGNRHADKRTQSCNSLAVKFLVSKYLRVVRLKEVKENGWIPFGRIIDQLPRHWPVSLDQRER
jgi:hypothetical protein